jgi:predicted GNAT family N-acyltransferase
MVKLYVLLNERETGMEIREITKEGLPAALDLIWKVFLEFEAPEYSQEGVDEFKRYIDQQAEELTLKVYGAFGLDELIGVIATRNEGSHISWFFVKKKNHGQGVGKNLFEHIVALCNSDFITVNSSPYAVKIYRRLGFTETSDEQVTNGIRYVPMAYIIGRNDG